MYIEQDAVTACRRFARTALAIGLLAFLAGCGTANADAPRAPAHQYIIGVDISASRTPTQLAEARRLVLGMIDRLQNGDRFVLIETYRAGTDSARQFFDSVPSARQPANPTSGDKKKLARFQSSARLIADGYIDPKRSKTVQTTDILTTLQRAADYAKSGNGRETTLLILSDMLNSTPELNMERTGGIPDSGWIAKRAADKLLPDLSNACVFAVGGDVRTERGGATRRFWRQYFAATGARYDDARNYRNMVADAREIACS